VVSQEDRLVVLSSPYPDGEKPNQTVILLVDSLPDWVEVRPFHLKTALFGRYDLIHWHWPEVMVRGTTTWQRIKRFLAVPILVARLRATNTPVVFTVHNEQAHEEGPFFERLALRMLDLAVTHRVFMYESAFASAPPAKTRDSLILKGDYAPLHPKSSKPRFDLAREKSLIIPGHLRPYKGIEEFLRTFGDLGTRGYQLRIVGRPLVAEYAARLATLVKAFQGVELEMSYLSDDELERQILSAEVVVLPYWRVYNSGVALLALTLKRPVIVQDSPTMRELAAEVGGDWVTILEFPADSQAFEAAYIRAREAFNQPLPNLSKRDWKHVGQKYAQLYAEAANFDATS
jgi:beta-1,4-mannosyltransferase